MRHVVVDEVDDAAVDARVRGGVQTQINDIEPSGVGRGEHHCHEAQRRQSIAERDRGAEGALVRKPAKERRYRDAQDGCHGGDDRQSGKAEGELLSGIGHKEGNGEKNCK